MKNRIGEKFITNQGYKVKIIKYNNYSNCEVIFEDGQIHITNYGNIKKGCIKNPKHPSVYNKGYLGLGDYKTKINGKSTKYYELWKDILERAYSTLLKEKKPTYKDVTVCEEWHNFQNFTKWFYENYDSDTMENWDLDKDILVKGNKTYSPETCCFVPKEINNLFRKRINKNKSLFDGVFEQKGRYYSAIMKNYKNERLGGYSTKKEAFQAYKIAKEEYIKEVAEKWKDKITEQVYQTMIDYKL